MACEAQPNVFPAGVGGPSGWSHNWQRGWSHVTGKTVNWSHVTGKPHQILSEPVEYRIGTLVGTSTRAGQLRHPEDDKRALDLLVKSRAAEVLERPGTGIVPICERPVRAGQTSRDKGRRQSTLIIAITVFTLLA